MTTTFLIPSVVDSVLVPLFFPSEQESGDKGLGKCERSEGGRGGIYFYFHFIVSAVGRYFETLEILVLNSLKSLYSHRRSHTDSRIKL